MQLGDSTMSLIKQQRRDYQAGIEKEASEEKYRDDAMNLLHYLCFKKDPIPGFDDCNMPKTVEQRKRLEVALNEFRSVALNEYKEVTGRDYYENS